MRMNETWVLKGHKTIHALTKLGEDNYANHFKIMHHDGSVTTKMYLNSEIEIAKSKYHKTAKDAYEEGSVIYYESIEPRYIKKINNEIHWSDDLVNWKKSSQQNPDVFTSDTWKIFEDK